MRNTRCSCFVKNASAPPVQLLGAPNARGLSTLSIPRLARYPAFDPRVRVHQISAIRHLSAAAKLANSPGSGDARFMKAVGRSRMSSLDGRHGSARAYRSTAAWTPVNREASASAVRRAPRRNWAINGDFVTLQPTGVARYAREVTAQLDALIAEGHPLTRGLDLELVVPRDVPTPFSNIPIHVVPEFNHPRLPQVWVQLQLPARVKGGLLSFCNLAPGGGISAYRLHPRSAHAPHA